MDTGEYRVVKTWDGQPEENPFSEGRRRDRQVEAALARLEEEEAAEKERQPKPPEEREPITEDRLPAAKGEGEEPSLLFRLLVLPFVQLLWWMIDRLGGSPR